MRKYAGTTVTRANSILVTEPQAGSARTIVSRIRDTALYCVSHTNWTVLIPANQMDPCYIVKTYEKNVTFLRANLKNLKMLADLSLDLNYSKV
jgi:hypothetical protein